MMEGIEDSRLPKALSRILYRLGWWYPSHVDALGMKAHWEMLKIANVSQIFRLSGEEYHMMKKLMIDPRTGK